jgi:hypothetical protein
MPITHRSSDDLSFVNQMMDNFVEGLCADQKNTSTVATIPKQNTVGTDMWENYRRLLQYDILVLLGWVEPPEHEEMETL